MRVTVLSGGVGGARFTRGLLALLRDRLPDGAGGTTAQVTVVANTGDDVWLHGVRVCPDLDTLMYTLGGGVHEGQGWGRAHESRRVSDDLAAYDLGWGWFTLGDLDLATHLARTGLLRSGLPLSAVTARLCERWRPGVTLLPMSDDEVETHVETADGTLLHFEEWWVRHRAALPARRFVQVGLDAAHAAPGVLDAHTAADVVVLPPANPVLSVGTNCGGYGNTPPGPEHGHKRLVARPRRPPHGHPDGPSRPVRRRYRRRNVCKRGEPLRYVVPPGATFTDVR